MTAVFPILDCRSSAPSGGASSRRAVVAAALAFVLLGPSVGAQLVRPDQLPAIDADTRAAIVESLTAVIDSVYVLGEPAGRIVTGLRESLAAGDYDELSDPAEFAQRLEADAQGIHHDGHFGIQAMPPLDPQHAEQREDPQEAALRERRIRAMNYGFEKVEILPGGVGYLKFDAFMGTDPEAFEAAAAAMGFLATCDAVILDLQDNGGGEASMIRFITGYLFAESTHLINWYERIHGRTVQSYSADYVPGRRLLEQPVYVLTSRRTFSAAEEFTFDLRNLERAIVVGDTTGGGGHTVASYVFGFDGFRMSIRVPYGRAYNPENDEGWEGVGIIPHIAVPVEQARDAAYADALRKLVEAEEDETYQAGLEWVLLGIEGRLHSIELPPGGKTEYVGRYGPRRIFLEGEALYYQRGDNPRYELDPLATDQFTVGDLGYFRIAFERDPEGRIVKLVGMYSNGATDENERDEG